MKKLVLSTLFAAFMGSTAIAADVQVVRPGVGFAPYSWSGVYLGLHAGYGWADADNATVLGAPFGTTDLNGFVGGGQVGWQWQQGQFVFGVEADASWANLNDNTGLILGVGLESDINFMGSARLRAGWAFDRAMLYITGGVALANNDVTLTVAPLTFSDNQTHVGWVIGGGLEYAFNRNWTGKIEYQYANFGSEAYSFLGVPNILQTGDVGVSTIRLGINYIIR